MTVIVDRDEYESSGTDMKVKDVLETVAKTGRVGNLAVEPASLDPRFVFLLDAGLRIFVWYGKRCKNVLKSKTRLMAEKISKNERKAKATIHIFMQVNSFLLITAQ